jgi:hypothetical protein
MKWDMPIRPIESGPLTDREIGELDAFLLAEDNLENPMDFYTFDGFICAALSGPKTIMPRNGCGGFGTRRKVSNLQSLRARSRRSAFLAC